MSRRSTLQTALTEYSTKDLQRVIAAKRHLDEREKHVDHLRALKQEVRREEREIRRFDRVIARLLKARRKPGRPKTAKKARATTRKVTKKRIRHGRKGRTLGLRPNSLASKIVEHLTAAPNQQARVTDIAEGLKGWKGKTDVQQLTRHVSATLTSSKRYFRRVERGIYALVKKG